MSSLQARVSELLRCIAHTGPLTDSSVAIPGGTKTVDVTRPRDTDRLLDLITGDPEQNLPYWAEIWPSGIALAGAILAHPERVRDRRVLELGCGVGVTAAVALAAGARLTVSDYAAEALVLARVTCLRHAGHEPERCERLNWRDPLALRAVTGDAPFDVVLGADLLYERRDIVPLLAALDVLVAPQGALWLAEPGRPPASEFLSVLSGGGWHDDTSRWEGPWSDPADEGVVVASHWLRRAP